MRRAAGALPPLVALLALGCPDPVFRGSLMLSTRTSAVPPHEVLGPVSSHYCDHLALLIVPFVEDQRDHVARMLAQVSARGGDALIDFQVRVEDTLFAFPVYLRWCWTLEGTAVRFRSDRGPA